MVTIFLNVGRKHLVTPGDIVGNEDVRRVYLGDRFSL